MEYKTPQSVLSLRKEILNQTKLSQTAIDAIINPDWFAVEREIEWAHNEKQCIISIDHSDYPAKLKQIAHPPLVLFVYGNPGTLDQNQLAIVGSRNPTTTALEVAFDFAKALTGCGLTITSGMAIGIDGAAHRGALSSSEGKTIAVLGSGLNHFYPKSHVKLAHAIAEQGAVISDLPLGSPAASAHFPKRNRIISGLSLGTLVVEAALKSGSLITARYAIEQNREVFAIPSSIRNPRAIGCHYLIKNGAKLVEAPEDILIEIEQQLPHKAKKQNYSVGCDAVHSNEALLDHVTLKLLDCVGFEITEIDHIIERSNLDAPAAMAALVLLELEGFIVKVRGGYIRTT